MSLKTFLCAVLVTGCFIVTVIYTRDKVPVIVGAVMIYVSIMGVLFLRWKYRKEHTITPSNSEATMSRSSIHLDGREIDI